MSKFVELNPSECEVIDAREYARPRHDCPMHPVVVFTHGKNTYQITDRYVLYSFLKMLDPELQYIEMMETIYDITIDERPSLEDIIQGYLHNTSIERLNTWVEKPDIRNKFGSEDIIASVETQSTMSRYFDTTMDYIGANFLPTYTRSYRRMIAGGRASKYPVMVFSKDDIRIEIISYNQKTFIAGRYRWVTQSGGLWVQPKPVAFCPRWAHLIPHTFLSMMLDDFHVLDSMNDLTKHSTIVGGGGESSRLNRWTERNSLEGENLFRFDRKTIQAINSFRKEKDEAVL